MQVFVIINNSGIKIDTNVNVNNWFRKVDAIMGLFEILVTVNMNVTNHVIIWELENI